MPATRIDSGALNLKLPPQHLDAEKSVLGSLLLQNNALDEVADFLRPAHFYSDANRLIYEAMLRMYEAGIRGIDAVTLAEELDRRKLLAEIGSTLYIHELIEIVPH